MELRLIVTAGPHAGREFAFDRHDTFLVGRAKDAHFRLSYDDPYFSRRHFLVEVNPPRVRVLDLESRNGTLVNVKRVKAVELRDGDEITAGTTVFTVHAPPPDPDQQATLDLDGPVGLPPTVPRPADHPGETALDVPGFELGEEIGRGGMGVVYRARRRADGEAVAVKTFLPAAGVGRKQLDRFARECRVLAGLEHPNIVAFLDGGATDAMAYLAMELIEGPNAQQLVGRHGPMPVAGAVRLACGLLAGLAHAHARGIVHRDVKPSNVLLGGTAGKRTVKVADFGLSRAYDDCKLSGLTLQGEVGGTPAFMAPEQVTHYRDVRPAADQYSAAATLYHLLTAKLPHDLPRDLAQQFVRIINDDPVPILDRRPDLPPALAEAIHRALAREPGRRVADAAEFRRALLPFSS